MRAMTARCIFKMTYRLFPAPQLPNQIYNLKFFRNIFHALASPNLLFLFFLSGKCNILKLLSFSPTPLHTLLTFHVFAFLCCTRMIINSRCHRKKKKKTCWEVCKRATCINPRHIFVEDFFVFDYRTRLCSPNCLPIKKKKKQMLNFQYIPLFTSQFPSTPVSEHILQKQWRNDKQCDPNQRGNTNSDRIQSYSILFLLLSHQNSH